MKTFGQQVLILGGFYFIISFLFGFGTHIVFDIINFVAVGIFFIAFVVLCFKRKFAFIDYLEGRFPRFVNYLSAFGALEYIGVIFGMIPGAIYGYNVAEAEYNGIEYHSSLPQYSYYFSFVYFGLFIFALGWATYKSVYRQT